MSAFRSPFQCGTNFFGHALPPQDTALTTTTHREPSLRITGNTVLPVIPTPYNQLPRLTFVARAYPPRKIVKDSSTPLFFVSQTDETLPRLHPVARQGAGVSQEGEHQSFQVKTSS